MLDCYLRMYITRHMHVGAFILAGIVASQPDSSCNDTCGIVSVPYPFGTREGCYLDPSFLITCNHSFEPPKPFLRESTIHVLNISLLDGELRVSNKVAYDCYNESGFPVDPLQKRFHCRSLPSHTQGISSLPSVATLLRLLEVQRITRPAVCTLCDNITSVDSGSCSGIGCCQTSIPEGITRFSVTVSSYKNHSAVHSFNPCGFGFVVEEEAYNFSSLDLHNLQDREYVPLVIDWAVGNETCEDAQKNMTSYACKAEYSYCYNSTNGPGYRCNCSDGFQGNPYLRHGCTGN
jgi:hypothetical protein